MRKQAVGGERMRVFVYATEWQHEDVLQTFSLQSSLISARTSRARALRRPPHPLSKSAVLPAFLFFHVQGRESSSLSPQGVHHFEAGKVLLPRSSQGFTTMKQSRVCDYEAVEGL